VNIFKVEYTPVNLQRLAGFPAGSEITLEALAEAGIIQSTREMVKILGDGELDRVLVINAHKFSASARTKIEAAGGTANIINSSAVGID
jgi:large subunit ribosomal protein L15